jgi:hypothetical protein
MKRQSLLIEDEDFSRVISPGRAAMQSNMKVDFRYSSLIALKSSSF